MISIGVIITIVIFHWFADFVMQRSDDAINKSKSFYHLVNHSFLYSVLWFFPLSFIFIDNLDSISFVVITFLLHTLTDYFTSKKTSEEFKYQHFGRNKLPRTFDFFVTIGFDQVLHYLQLFLTYYLLNN